MANTSFIGEAYIRENTVFNQNLDIKDIVQNIDPAADMHIQPILGTNFYNTLLLAYSAQTLTANETTLVMHIKPALAYRAAEMSLPFIQYQIKNKGPQTQSGDNSTNVDQTVLHYLRNELKNRAEFYETRLTKYLNANTSLFSGYTSNNNDDITPDGSTNTYDSGFATYGKSECFFKKYGYLND
jgi:hypothetical protein